MTFDEALLILGIPRTAGPDGAKKAYLALLSKHGPEPPPDLWGPVSAAYDLLKRQDAWGDAATPQAARAAVRAPPGHDKTGGTPPRRRRPIEVAAPPRREAPAPLPAPAVADDDEAAEAAAPSPPQRQPGADKPAARRLAAYLSKRHAPQQGRKAREAGPRSREQEDVVAAVARLERTFKPLVVADALLDALDEPGDDRTIALLRELARREELLAAAGVASAMLELMTGHSQRRYLAPRSAVRLLLMVQLASEHDHRAAAGSRALLRALERWLDGHGDAGPTLDVATESRWRWARTLASLPEEMPGPVRYALLRAADRGDLGHAREEVAAWVAQVPNEEAIRARLHLTRHAPELVRSLAGVLPEPTRRRFQAVEAADLRELRFPRWILPVAALVLVAGLTSWYFVNSSEYDGRVEPHLEAAGAQICATLGDHTRACVWSTILARSLSEESCGLVRKALPQLGSEIQRAAEAGTATGTQLAAVRAQHQIFQRAFKETCHR